MIQKISFRQTFIDILNLRCDLDLEHSNPIFSHDTPAFGDVSTRQVWLQKAQQFGRYSRKYILIM